MTDIVPQTEPWTGEKWLVYFTGVLTGLLIAYLVPGVFHAIVGA